MEAFHSSLDGQSSLPPFDSSGHLPVGIHDCSLDALARATRFNSHRRKLWSQLISFLAWPILSRRFSHAYIGGGFASNHAEPRDIDVVLETSKPFGAESMAAVERFFAIGLDQVETVYGVHLHFWMQNGPSGLTDYRAFFQYLRPTPPSINASCGIARISLTAPSILGQLRSHLRGEWRAESNQTSLELTATRDQLGEEARRMQGVMGQLALMGQYTPKMVILTDTEGRVEWVNESFVETCGYTLRELRGTKPGTILQGAKSDPATVEILRHAVRSMRDCDCRIINYTKDGTPYPVHISMGPVFNDGKPEGFLAVEEVLSEARQGATAAGLPS